MVMNAFDTTFDGANEVYAVNSIAFHHMKHPIVVDKTRPVRIYLVNVVEFDLINSFHLHANFFDYYDSGTTLEPTLRTVDTFRRCQAQRGILEFSFAEHEAGLYMFHAHVTEFTELGWMAAFDVRGWVWRRGAHHHDRNHGSEAPACQPSRHDGSPARGQRWSWRSCR